MATLRDVDAIALALPETAKQVSDDGRPAYAVAGKTFCFHRPWRKDAPFDDVFVFHVDGLEEKDLLLADPRGIFFTTPHWQGYAAVLVHIPDLKQVMKRELHELVETAWLVRAPKKLAKAWLSESTS